MAHSQGQQPLTDIDIIKLAIRQEEYGYRFYSAAAEHADAPEVKQVFQKLAEEEKEHAQVFRQILDSIQQSSNPVFGSSSTEYIRAILDKGIFHDSTAEMEVPRIENYQDALAIGIQAEKDAILFYQEIINQTSSPEAKRTIERMLAAEKMHLVDLRNYLEESQNN